MSYPHHPYGYEPTHCPVIGLVPRRRLRCEPEYSEDCDVSNEDTKPDKRPTPVVTTRHIGFPFANSDDGTFSAADVEAMIEYVITTRQGWRASLVMRAFLRWWRATEPYPDIPEERKLSDAMIMLLALNQGREGFVQGYLHDLYDENQRAAPKPQPDRTGASFNRSLRIAALALALSPIFLVFAVLIFVQIDSLVSGHSGKIFGFSYDLLFFVGAFGAIGALTSMMMRLGKDVKWDEMDPTSVFFNFLFRPCMGFCFALLVLLALRAGMLPIPLDQLQNIDDLDEIGKSAAASQQISIVLVLAFLSGFSERLSSAMVKRVEDRVARTD